MISKTLKEIKIGDKCSIDNSAYLGFEENGSGRIIIGNRVRIRPGVILRTCSGTIVIGNDSVLGVNTIIHALGNVVIGETVLISPNVGIYAQNHGIKKGKSIAEQDNIPGRIEIKNGSWIGAGAIIVGPVVIGSGAVVGAGSVVNNDVPDNAIVGGNPAKFIRYRE
jgi:acetyltransferase-like isoleucine patch superfamily enzyme